MADENDNPEIVEPVEGEDPPAPETAEEVNARWEAKLNEMQSGFSKTLNDMNLQMAGLQGGYNALIASQTAGNKVEAPVIHIPTEDDIAAAYEEGDFKKAAKLTRQMSEGISKRDTMTMRETEINPLRHTVENVGLKGMANLTNLSVLNGLTPAAKEFYQKHKQAVDGHFANLPAEAKVDPAAFTGALAYEMGMASLNGGLETQINDEVERRIRSGNQPGSLKPGGRNQGSGEPQDFVKIFGEGAKQALEESGLTWDGYAQKMGYDDMNDMVAKTGAQ